jgi:hypothetical protein
MEEAQEYEGKAFNRQSKRRKVWPKWWANHQRSMLDGKNLVKKSTQNNGTKPRPVPLGNWMRARSAQLTAAH